jgi:hypothetical protein
MYLRIILLFCLLLLTTCNNKSKTEYILKEWIGKIILFPDIKPVSTFSKDNVHKEYKILIYTNSVGCLSCKLRINVWKSYIKELGNKVDFLFYFNSTNEKEFLYWAKRLESPVFIDENNELDKLNHFSNNPAFQCFLLDMDNKVLVIGNPVMNPAIWELYKKIINEEIKK